MFVFCHSFSAMSFSQPNDAVIRLAKDGGIDRQLLADEENVVGVGPDVVPMAEMVLADTETARDAAEVVAAGDCVDNVRAIVHIRAVRIRHKIADAAGDEAEFCFTECHLYFPHFHSVFFLFFVYSGSL